MKQKTKRVKCDKCKGRGEFYRGTLKDILLFCDKCDGKGVLITLLPNKRSKIKK